MKSQTRIISFFILLFGLTAPISAQALPMAAGVKFVILENEYTLTLTNGQDAYGHEVFSIRKEIQGSEREIPVKPQDKARLLFRLKGIEQVGYRLKAIEIVWGFDVPQVEIEIKSGVNFVRIRDFKANIVKHKIYADLCRELERLAN